MRHNNKFNHLGRTSSHRKAMLANMACSLIMSKRIKTTLAKAKALRMYVEPLISKTKNLNTVDDQRSAQRLVFSYLRDKHAVKELFTEVGEKVATRPGGYTRILKLGNRVGDAADVCYIELVDYNANMLTAPKGASEKKKTRRSGGKKKAESAPAQPAPVAEAPAQEAPVAE